MCDCNNAAPRYLASQLMDPFDAGSRILSASKSNEKASFDFRLGHFASSIMEGLRQLGLQSMKDVPTFLAAARALQEVSVSRWEPNLSGVNGRTYSEAEIRDYLELMRFLCRNYKAMDWTPSACSVLRFLRVVPVLDLTSEIFPPTPPSQAALRKRLEQRR